MRYKLINYAVTIVFLFVIVELTMFCVFKADLLPIVHSPLYYSQNFLHNGLNWRTEMHSFGAWHKKNFKDRHVTDCFNVAYSTNSFGARDGEFNFNDSKRVGMLLGDSFAEGYGLSDGSRFDNFLEIFSGTNIMNFGTAYDHGPLNTLILYDELASKFNSDFMVILHLPANDYWDNNYTSWYLTGLNKIINTDRERYRPYYSVNGGYFIPRLGLKRFDVLGVNADTSYEFLRQYTWFSQIISNFFFVTRSSQLVTGDKNEILGNDVPVSSIFHADPKSLTNVLSTYETLVTKYNKPVYMYVVATRNELSSPNYVERIKNSNLYSSLELLSKRHRNFHFIYAMPEKNNSEELFLSCDGHWSEAGAKSAAASVARLMKLH